MKLSLLYILIIPAIASALIVEPRVRTFVKKRVHNCTRRSKRGDVLYVNFKGWLEGGEVFDSSVSDKDPYRFILGYEQVIKGWDIGLKNMCIGEKRHLVIPPEFAYGDTGSGYLIPPGATLYFDVELVRMYTKTEL